MKNEDKFKSKKIKFAIQIVMKIMIKLMNTNKVSTEGKTRDKKIYIS